MSYKGKRKAVRVALKTQPAFNTDREKERERDDFWHCREEILSETRSRNIRASTAKCSYHYITQPNIFYIQFFKLTIILCTFLLHILPFIQDYY